MRIGPGPHCGPPCGRSRSRRSGPAYRTKVPLPGGSSGGNHHLPNKTTGSEDAREPVCRPSLARYRLVRISAGSRCAPTRGFARTRQSVMFRSFVSPLPLEAAMSDSKEVDHAPGAGTPGEPDPCGAPYRVVDERRGSPSIRQFRLVPSHRLPLRSRCRGGTRGEDPFQRPEAAIRAVAARARLAGAL